MENSLSESKKRKLPSFAELFGSMPRCPPENEDSCIGLFVKNTEKSRFIEIEDSFGNYPRENETFKNGHMCKDEGSIFRIASNDAAELTDSIIPRVNQVFSCFEDVIFYVERYCKSLNISFARTHSEQDKEGNYKKVTFVCKKSGTYTGTKPENMRRSIKTGCPFKIKGAYMDAEAIRILVTTDNHLGFMEKDPVRCNDSFVTMEEIFQLAIEHKVDFILFGGDIFHDNKPSRATLYRTIEMMRMYSLGDDPCYLSLLSDPAINFHTRFGNVNYMDPNLNVSLPLFSIHGNHDDPTGDVPLSSLDILSAAGLVNYFGRTNEVDNICLSPVLLQKGNVKLALYGLGNVRDERLHRTFRSNNVKMLRPTEDPEEFFNLFVIHQNRLPHSATNYIPESFLEPFIDLVIWGHEHECLIEPTQNMSKGFYVSQPGSSIATSLCEAELKPKAVGLLTITGPKKFTVEKLVLKTTRPFVAKEIRFSEMNLVAVDCKGIEKAVKRVVEEMIVQSSNEWKTGNGFPPEDASVVPPKPLIRLKIDISGANYTLFNPQRFGQAFVNKVANPRDILHFVKRNRSEKTNMPEKDLKEKQDKTVKNMLSSNTNYINTPSLKIEDLVDEFLKIQSLNALPQKALAESVRIFVEKDEKDAIEGFISKALFQLQSGLQEKLGSNFSEESILDLIKSEKQFMEGTGTVTVREPPSIIRPKETIANDASILVDESDEEPSNEESNLARSISSRGRRGRGRGKLTTTTVQRRKPAQTAKISSKHSKYGRDSNIEYDDDE